MKIKQSSKDFVVEEVADFSIKKYGEHRLYSLTKENIDTFELISQLSLKNNIPKKDFSIAGIKDKRGITTQNISIPKNFEFKKLKGDNYSLRFLGFIDEPIMVGSLSRNKFTIIIRDLTLDDIKNIEVRVRDLAVLGVPNYFDSQRFGSIVEEEFIGKAILQKDFEGAVKLFLYSQYIRENLSKHVSKQEFFLLVENFEKKLNYPYYLSLQSRFVQSNGSWKLTYRSIPVKLREIFIMAYQSYMWNECIKQFLQNKFEEEDLVKVEYVAGELFFYKNDLSMQKILNKFPKTFNLIGRKFEFEYFEEQIIKDIIEKENITHLQIKALSKIGSFLKTEKREMIIRPNNLKILEISKDELSTIDKKKVKISFSLTKGSYATLIIKALFGE